jgi:glycosyltransferase involved in cell wall biosynthesis
MVWIYPHFLPKLKRRKCRKKFGLDGKNVFRGVAMLGVNKKGCGFFELVVLGKCIQIVLLGYRGHIKSSQKYRDSENGIIDELAAIYNVADIFLNPTYQDNFPTTNIEALACGTPVVTYRTGGSPEALDLQTGMVVEKGNLDQLVEAIKAIESKGKATYTQACRERAV